MQIDVFPTQDGRGWFAEVWGLQTGELFHTTPVYPDRARARAEAIVWITAQGKL